MSQILQFASLVIRNLPSNISPAIMQGWNEAPGDLQIALRAALMPSFRIWQTVRIGTGLTKVRLLQELEAQEIQLGQRVELLFNDPFVTFSSIERNVDLVVVTPKDLGLQERLTLRELCQSAKRRGLELCTPEIAVQLRMQYVDQEQGERLIVGMEPINWNDGPNGSGCHTFEVIAAEGQLWLDSNCGYGEDPYEDLYVFVCPRQAK